MVIVTVLLIGTPTVFLALAVVDDIHTVNTALEAGRLAIPPPNPSVADWPVIGDTRLGIRGEWTSAAFFGGIAPVESRGGAG
jgi:hypothetical protein